MEIISEQLSLFGDVKPRKVIGDKPIRLIECFGGIGAQSRGLEILGITNSHYKYIEWNYKSCRAYNLIHIKDFTDYAKDKTIDEMLSRINGISADWNEPMQLSQIKRKGKVFISQVYNDCVATNNLVNITQVKGEDLEIVETDKYEYIMWYSFPCQDLSLAGKLQGAEDNSTRSGLLWEIDRILKELKTNKLELPQTLIMENVPNLLSPRFKKEFEKWEYELTKLGYSNFIKVMNGSDYGIPQIRKRVFMVSILGDYDFTFPSKMRGGEYYMSDFQEDSSKVDSKYFLSKKLFQCFASTKNRNGFIRANSFIPIIDQTKETLYTITCKPNARPAENFILIPAKQYKNYISFIDKKGRQNTQDNRVYNKNEVVTIPTGRGIPKILVDTDTNSVIVKEATSKGFAEAHIGDSIYIDRPHQKRGVVQTESIQTIKTSSKDLALVVMKNGKVNLRALTPKETLIFMGFTKQDYDLLVEDGFSDSTIYHLAGDSIITTIASCIMSRLIFKDLDHHLPLIRNYTKTLLRENRND